MNLETPILASPIEFSIPLGVPTILVGGFPSRGFRESDFVTIAPSLLTSARSRQSSP